MNHIGGSGWKNANVPFTGGRQKGARTYRSFKIRRGYEELSCVLLFRPDASVENIAARIYLHVVELHFIMNMGARTGSGISDECDHVSPLHSLSFFLEKLTAMSVSGRNTVSVID